jgi:hypothetical protein
MIRTLEPLATLGKLSPIRVNEIEPGPERLGPFLLVGPYADLGRLPLLSSNLF